MANGYRCCTSRAFFHLESIKCSAAILRMQPCQRAPDAPQAGQVSLPEGSKVLCCQGRQLPQRLLQGCAESRQLPR